MTLLRRENEKKKEREDGKQREWILQCRGSLDTYFSTPGWAGWGSDQSYHGLAHGDQCSEVIEALRSHGAWHLHFTKKETEAQGKEIDLHMVT